MAANKDKSQPHWKVAEAVVAAIEHSLADVLGTKVTLNARVPERIAGVRRQVDVLVEIPASERTFRIAVEVRDRRTPVSLPDAEGLISKLQKLDVDKGVIVARAGFSAEAEIAASMAGVQALTLEAVEAPGWWRADFLESVIDSINFLDIRWIDNGQHDDFYSKYPDFASSWKEIEVRWPGVTRSITAQIDKDVRERVLMAAPTGVDDITLIVPLEYTDTGCAFLYHGEEMPLPDRVEAVVRLRRQRETIVVSAWKTSGRTAVTGVSPGTGRQFTIVGHGDAGGLTLVVQDPPGKPTVVPRRGRAPRQPDGQAG